MNAQLAAACLFMVSLTMGANAHHSRAAFALDETRSFEGRLIEIGWHNPHAYLVVEVGSGENDQWTFEGHSISGLVRLGWRRDSLRAGERVRVVANPAKNEAENFALLSSITIADGRTLYAFKRPAGETAEPQAPLQPSKDFSGTWKPIRSLRSALLGGFKPPSDWPYTQVALDEIADFDINNDPALDCVSTGLPRMIKWPYSQRWNVSKDHIEIITDQSDNVRDIGLTSERPPLEIDIARVTGLSHGQMIDSKTLLIETTNFRNERWGNARGVSSSVGKRVTETYRLAADGYKLEVTYALEDPQYLTEPVTQSAEFELVADYPFNSVPCDPKAAKRHLQFE